MLKVSWKKALTLTLTLSLFGLAHAQTPADIGLDGEQVIVFPAHQVPFLQSYRVINQGQKNEDGNCDFPLDSDGPPQPLGENERWITVQLAWDPVTCQEVLEKGVVDGTDPQSRARTRLAGAQ